MRASDGSGGTCDHEQMMEGGEERGEVKSYQPSALGSSCQRKLREKSENRGEFNTEKTYHKPGHKDIISIHAINKKRSANEKPAKVLMSKLGTLNH